MLFTFFPIRTHCIVVEIRTSTNVFLLFSFPLHLPPIAILFYACLSPLVPQMHRPQRERTKTKRFREEDDTPQTGSSPKLSVFLTKDRKDRKALRPPAMVCATISFSSLSLRRLALLLNFLPFSLSISLQLYKGESTVPSALLQLLLTELSGDVSFLSLVSVYLPLQSLAEFSTALLDNPKCENIWSDYGAAADDALCRELHTRLKLWPPTLSESFYRDMVGIEKAKLDEKTTIRRLTFVRIDGLLHQAVFI